LLWPICCFVVILYVCCVSFLWGLWHAVWFLGCWVYILFDCVACVVGLVLLMFCGWCCNSVVNIYLVFMCFVVSVDVLFTWLCVGIGVWIFVYSLFDFVLDLSLVIRLCALRVCFCDCLVYVACWLVALLLLCLCVCFVLCYVLFCLVVCWFALVVYVDVCGLLVLVWVVAFGVLVCFLWCWFVRMFVVCCEWQFG